MVSTARDQPWLGRVPFHAQSTQSLNTLVDILEDLDGDNQWVLQQIVVDHAVENLDIAIVRTRGKQRVALVVCHRADGLSVVSQSLVGLGRQIQIEPAQTLIIRSNDQVVSCWVHIQRRNPLDTGHHRLDQLLALQVVLADISLGGDKEHGLGRVEHDALDGSLGLLEGLLSLVLGQLVDEDSRVVGVGCNSSKVVSLAVPGHLLDGLLEVDPDTDTLLKFGGCWLLP